MQKLQERARTLASRVRVVNVIIVRIYMHSASMYLGGARKKMVASFLGLLPPSPLRMLTSDNYAWVYLRMKKAWYILSRDACRGCHKASSCGAVI